MAYCDTAGCTGTHTCTGQVYPTSAAVFYDACTAAYTDPQCNTRASGDSDWCKQSVPGATFYQVANVTIEASSWPGLLNNVVSQRPAVYSDFTPADVPQIRSVWVEAALSIAGQELESGACWCEGGASTRDWFPFGIIRHAALSEATLSFRSNSSVLPPPWDYYPRTSSFLYLRTLYTNGEPALVSVYTYNDEMKLVKLHRPDIAISSETCGSASCTHYSTSIELYGISECRFVCAAVLSTSATFPNTVMIDPSLNVSACTIRSNFVWIQHAALARMSVSEPWQHAADTVRSTQLYMWVPWLNLSTSVGASSNCNELALQYCSLELTHYATMEELYCAWAAVMDAGTLEWMVLTNIVGMNDWWLETGQSGSCGSYTSASALNVLVPTVVGVTEPPDDTSTDTLLTFRRHFYNLFWTNLAARSFGYDIPLEATRCNGTAGFSIQANESYTMTVTHGLAWVNDSRLLASECIGLDGCSDIAASVCVSVPGCYLSPTSTVTSTSTQTTVGFGTFPPKLPPTNPPIKTLIHAEQAARLATVSVAAVLTVILLILVTVSVRHGQKTQYTSIRDRIHKW